MGHPGLQGPKGDQGSKGAPGAKGHPGVPGYPGETVSYGTSVMSCDLDCSIGMIQLMYLYCGYLYLQDRDVIVD